MNFTKLCVAERMVRLPLYVNVNDNLALAVKRFEEFNVEKIAVTDENFSVIGIIQKREIGQYMLKKGITKRDELEKCSVGELINKETTFVMAYPHSELIEIFQIMKSIKTHYLPIVKSPWNKKLEGFIALEENFLQAI